MTIAALSGDTTRAISSSLVLSDAISVVKELLDNALDSYATNITIEISANTVETIQVRDNGSGIGIEDRQLLCKRGYTSKIRTVEDLAQLGGSFLGFRGEALASIAELSESVTFTTRVDGETVATCLKFDSKGKLTSCSSASHSTGTTVRVSDFLKSIPVRKQTALKQAMKTLSNLKKLLFDYAFARPTVRFQLKVLKSKSDLKNNWLYVPCKEASNLTLVASKIVGKDIASLCKQQSITSDDGAYRFDALLLAKECDVSKLGSSNNYISIDGRPVTAERGVMKDLSKTYKAFLRNVISETSNHSTKHFMCLQLTCPPGSYDVNVEPAKDQVLFEDSSKVLQLFAKLCANVYGEKVTESITETTTAKASSRSKEAASNYGFDILLAKKKPPSPGPAHARSAEQSDHNSGNLPTSPSCDLANGFSEDMIDHVAQTVRNKDEQSHNIVQKSMYTLDNDNDDDDDFEVHNNDLPTKSDINLTEGDEDVMDVQVRNPFVLAKVNTRVQPQNLSLGENIPTGREGAVVSVDEHDQPKHRASASGEAGSPASMRLLPSFGVSPERVTPYQNPGPPSRPWKSRREREDKLTESFLPAKPITQTPQPARPTLLENWAQTVNSSSPAKHPSHLLEVQHSRSLDGSLGHPRQPLNKTDDLDRPETPTKSARKLQQSTFRTPFKQSGNDAQLPAQGGDATLAVSLQPAKQNLQTMLPSPAPTHNNASPQFPGFTRPQLDPSTELDDIMDFEHRKRDTILQHRGRLRQVRSSNSETNIDQKGVRDQQFLVSSSTYNKSPSKKDMAEGIDYTSQFKDMGADSNIPEQPNSASYTQNPHWNRYRKAVRDLDEREGADRQRKAGRLGGQDDDDGAEHERHQLDLVSPAATLSPHDPRAYLIRQKDHSNLDEETRTKLSRTKTAQLPFERIPADARTHVLVATLDSSSERSGLHIADVRNRVVMLKKHEPYIQTGKVEPAMSGAAVETATLQDWEAISRRLVQEKVLSKLSSATSEAQTVEDLHIGLSGKLQKHFERFEG